MLDFLKKSKKAASELYMGLILKENEGEVILLSADAETRIIHPLDQKKFTYTNSWEHLDGDVDQTLFELEKRNGVEIEKTVLFIYSHFVDQEKKTIKSPYKGKIKSLSDDLGLTIMGFVEFHEALGIYFHNIEQTPLSAIVIELDGPSVTVFVYKAGKIEHAETLAQTTDLIGDLEAVFTKLKGSYLPARMILYDSTDLTEVSNKIMSHSWDESLFIQIPKVEIVAPEKLQNALYSCFSKQIFEETIPGVAMSAAGSVLEPTDDEEEPAPAPVDVVVPPEEVVAPVAAAGFSIGKDIAQDAPAHALEVDEEEVVPTPVVTPITAVDFTNNVSNEDRVEISEQPPKKSFTIPTITMPAFLSSLNFSFLRSKGLVIAVVLLVAVLLVGGAFASVYSFHKAQIVLMYKTPKITKEIVMNNLRTKDESTSLDVSGTVKATGKKTIGTEAKGNIQIFNVEKAQRSLKKGTELKTDSGVIFVLNSDVSVASASASTTSGGDVTITTGKQKAAVTAKEIGPAGNIAGGTKLVFEGISSESLKASADGAFSGGTKRDVTTVSREDIEKLTKKVTDSAKNEAKTTASIQQLATVKLSNEKYTREVGEEAADVSVKAKATVTIPQSDEAAVKSELARKLISDVEDGFSLTKDSIQYIVTKAEEKKGSVTATLKVQATPQYVLSREKFLTEIKGKSIEAAGEIAKNDFRATDFDITIETFLPFLKTRIPFFDKNIQTETRSL